jgi:flagellar basal body-associated protein FliL
MTLILVRILLVLAPVVLLVMWLMRKAKTGKSNKELARDIKEIRKVLLVVLGTVAFIAVALYSTEDKQGSPEQIYVPARVKDGKLVPGYFKDIAPEQDENSQRENDTAPEGSQFDADRAVDDGDKPHQ